MRNSRSHMNSVDPRRGPHGISSSALSSSTNSTRMLVPGSSGGRQGKSHRSHRNHSSVFNTAEKDTATSKRKTKIIIILGVTLPVLACILGIAAWAVTTDVVRISSRNDNSGFRRFGHQEKTRIRDDLQSRNDVDVDVLLLPRIKDVLRSQAHVPTGKTTQRDATQLNPTSGSKDILKTLKPIHKIETIASTDIISKLISAGATKNNPAKFVVFAPVVDTTTDSKKEKDVKRGRQLQGKTVIEDEMDLVAEASVNSEEISQETESSFDKSGVNRRHSDPISKTLRRISLLDRDVLTSDKKNTRKRNTRKPRIESPSRLETIRIGSARPPQFNKKEGFVHFQQHDNPRPNGRPNNIINRSSNFANKPSGLNTDHSNTMHQIPHRQPVTEYYHPNSPSRSESSSFQQSELSNIEGSPTGPQPPSFQGAPQDFPPPFLDSHSGPPPPFLDSHSGPPPLFLDSHSGPPPPFLDSHSGPPPHSFQGSQTVPQPPMFQSSPQDSPPPFYSSSQNSQPPFQGFQTNSQQSGPQQSTFQNIVQNPQNQFQGPPQPYYGPQQQFQDSHQTFQGSSSRHFQNSQPISQANTYHGPQQSLPSPQMTHQGPQSFPGSHVGMNPSTAHMDGGSPQYFAPPPQNFHATTTYNSQGPQYSKFSSPSSMSSYESIAQSSINSEQTMNGPPQHHHHHHHHHDQNLNDGVSDINLSNSPSTNDADRLGSVGIGLGPSRGITVQIGGGGGGGGMTGLLPLGALGIARGILSSLLPRPTLGLNGKVFLGVEVGKGGGITIG